MTTDYFLYPFAAFGFFMALLIVKENAVPKIKNKWQSRAGKFSINEVVITKSRHGKDIIGYITDIDRHIFKNEGVHYIFRPINLKGNDTYDIIEEFETTWIPEESIRKVPVIWSSSRKKAHVTTRKNPPIKE